MTEQEIERIRTFLGSEYSVTKVDGSVVVDRADIWKGVEFAECDSDAFDSYTLGKIYPILSIEGEWVMTKYDDKLSHSNGLHKSQMKTSTEADYVEQLKAKAKELYGEIKDGDRYDRSEMGFGIGEVRLSFNGWDYSKSDDKLYFGTICIYQQGKWAKKIERVRVEFTWSEGVKEDYRFHFKTSSNDNFHEAGEHLAKCLEDYLNKSQ